MQSAVMRTCLIIGSYYLTIASVLTKNLFPLATVAKVTIFHVAINLTPLATL